MLKIVFDGCPISQARARHFIRNGKQGMYDPQAQIKKILRIQAQKIIDVQYNGMFKYELLKYPTIDFFFMMPIPKSMPKKMREIASKGMLKHINKPDIDNLIKLQLDVLNGILYKDDCCVAVGKAYKLYSEKPRTIMMIKSREAIITEKELYD